MQGGVAFVGRGLGAGGVGGTMVMDVTEHSLGTGGWDL